MLLQRSRSLRSECHDSTRLFAPSTTGFNEVAPFGASVTIICRSGSPSNRCFNEVAPFGASVTSVESGVECRTASFNEVAPFGASVTRSSLVLAAQARLLQRSRSLRSECHMHLAMTNIGAFGFNEVAPFGASVTIIEYATAAQNGASTKSLPSERVSLLFACVGCIWLWLQRSRSLRSECHI